ncbi:MAG: cation diffusion facilitator family transporter, partial [Thermotogota bacterium]
KAAGWVNRNLLSAEGATRNTVVVDAVLAFLKLLTGFITGSVGLIADGTDAALDTLTAGVVFWSVKKKREVIGSFVIIAMMFVTAIGLGFDSFSSIVDAIRGDSESIVRPVLVIIVESVALVFAWLLMVYQRFVGKKRRSLALISQSVDSKNHIYVVIAVIAGAIFSVFNIHFVDAAIGAYIAIKIFIDSISLFRETVSSMQGEEIDFDKFSGHLDKKWKSEKTKAFMATVIFNLLKHEPMKEEDLISTLKETFQPGYIPVLSEFQFGFASNTDFEKLFPDIIQPLSNQEIVIQEENGYHLNEEKRIEIEEYCSNTFITEVKPNNVQKRAEKLYHNDFDAIDGIGKIGNYLNEDEHITAITRGKHGKGICLLITTDQKVHIFSRRANNHFSFSYDEIVEIEEKSSRFSTIRFIIKTSKETHTFDYLSHRKSFGWINEFKRRLNPSSMKVEMETEDEFSQRINFLHRIQDYLGKVSVVP